MPSVQELMNQLGRMEQNESPPKLVDLTALARAGKFNPTVGRDQEIEETLEILNQHRKANALLIGPAGSGKTAVVEGLAMVLARFGGHLPGQLKDARIMQLDTSDLIADTGIVGELEKRIGKLAEKMRDDHKLILFVDEIHTLYGAGAGRNSQADAANLLKPLLARDGCRLIGATTDVEYASVVRRDPAFERRFSMIQIAPLSVSATTDALNAYLRYRGWDTESNGLIEAIAQMASLALPHRVLPDSAIDLLERAISISQLQSAVSVTLTEASVSRALLRTARLPPDLDARLQNAINTLPAVEPIAAAIGQLLKGEIAGPVVHHSDDPVTAETVAAMLGQCLGGRIDIDINRTEKRELLGGEPGSIGYGERRPLHGLVERPYSVLLIRGADQAGPNQGLLNEITGCGYTIDSCGQKISARVVITAPAREGHKTFGFI